MWNPIGYWITCDLSSTLQLGGNIIVDELTVFDVKVDAHFIVVGKSIGKVIIH